MKNLQKGFSAFEIILVVLVFALIGVVGYLGYKQIFKAEDKAPSVVTTTTKPAKEAFSEEYSGVGAGKKMSIKYPKSWTFEKEQSGSIGIEASDRIVSPSGDVAVLADFFTGENGGIGGVECTPEGQPTISKLQYYDLEQAQSYYLLSSENSDSGYRDIVVDQKNRDSVKQGDSTCELQWLHWFIRDDNGFASVSIQSPTLYKKQNNSEAITPAELRAYHDSEDFKTAQEIVKTLKIED